MKLKLINNLITKIKNNKIEFILFLAIFIIACFLRFYNLTDFLHFANDEARDAFVVKDIIEKGSLPLLGPKTSIGHFYLGPIFYYFLTPFFLVFQNHPVSGAILSAILGIASILLLYKIVKEIFSKEAALISSFLYSISYIVILHSRWSWNLNLIPFFILLYLYSFWKIISFDKTNKWFYIWVFSLGVMLQLHASAFLLLPVSIILFLIYRPKNLSRYSYFVGISILIIIFAPFLIYEFNNNFENSRKIIEVIFYENNGFSLLEKLGFNFSNLISFISALIFANFSNINDNFSFKENSNFLNIFFLLSLLLFLIIISFSIFYIFKNKLKKESGFIFIFSILLIFTFLISKKVLFLHYYIIFFPLMFILIGLLLSFIYQKNIFGKLIAVFIISFVFFLNISYLFNFWINISRGIWQKNHEITFFQLENSVNYIAQEAKNDKIDLKCDIEDYCQSFQYLLELKNIKIDKNSNSSFRVYKSFETRSPFKPISIEKIN